MKCDKKTVRDLRDALLEKQTEVRNKLKAESRLMTAEEQTAWNANSLEIDKLDNEFRQIEQLGAHDQRTAKPVNPTVHGGPEGNKDASGKDKRDVASYSILSAIRSKIDPQGHPLSGIELEMHQEADKEARAHNQTLNGLGVPKMVMQAGASRRDNSITMPTQPQDGSALVETDVVLSMNDLLQNALVLRQLGARFITDLVGNTSFVKDSTVPVATWKPEVGELDKSNITFESLSFAPKRIGTKIHESMQFIRQTGPTVERMMRERLVTAIAEGIQKAAIVGTGTGNEPLGIASHTGVTKIASGANGDAVTRARLIQAIATLLANNVTDTRLGWAINGLTAAHLMATPVLATGSDKFLLDTPGSLLGYPVAMTNAVPANGTAGTTTTPSLSTAVFGAFSNLYIGQWGGFDLLVDPYTLGSNGQVRLIIQAFADVLVYEPKAFVAITGIKTT